MSLRYASLKEVPRHLLRGVEAPAVEPKQSKYRNRFTWVDGKRFDSALESRCYQELTFRWKAGDILWFVRQVVFDLPGGVKYKADFMVVTKSGVLILDAKGMDTQDSKNKRKQVKEIYGIEVILWSDGK